MADPTTSKRRRYNRILPRLKDRALMGWLFLWVCCALVAASCQRGEEVETKVETAVETLASQTPTKALLPSDAERARAKPVVASLRQDFQNAEAVDSLRLIAGRELLTADVDFLVASYGQRDHARLVRQVIAEKIATNDASVLPLILGLFITVNGEERIDFEEGILYFGRRAETDLQALLHATDPSLVMRAVDTLAKMGSTASADSIACLLDDPEPWVRMAAAHALGEIGAPGASIYLVQTLDDSTYSVVNAALVGLGRLRAVEAYEHIMALTADDNKHVRKHAAIALGEIGDPRAITTVRQMAEHDTDSGVRFMAAKALEKLEDHQ